MSTPNDSNASKDNNGRDLLVAGVIVFALSLGALVTLTVMDRETSQLMALVGPVVAALLVSGHVNRVTNQQNQSIEKIDRQTNGVLDARIRRQTTEALKDVGLIAPATRVQVDLTTDTDQERG